MRKMLGVGGGPPGIELWHACMVPETPASPAPTLLHCVDAHALPLLPAATLPPAPACCAWSCRLSQFTYCVTSCLQELQPQLDAPRLAVAVMYALKQPGVEGDGKAYDLAMLLRHMCQLSREPPAGCEEHLLPALLGRMPEMSSQELSTVLHVACEWRLPQKQQLARAAMQLVAAAVAARQGTTAAAAAAQDVAHEQQPLLVERSALLRQQLRQQLQARQAARQAATAAQGTDRAYAAEHAYQATRATTQATLQHLQCTERFVAAWQHALHGPDVAGSNGDANSGAGQQSVPSRQRQQQQQQRRRQPKSQLLPRSATDAVILLHRFCCCDVKPSGALLTYLLQETARQLHTVSLLQVCRWWSAHNAVTWRPRLRLPVLPVSC